MKRFILLTVLSLICGCSSGPIVTTSESQPDKILSRINDSSSRPNWLDEERPFVIKDGKLISLGQTSIPGDNRVEAAYTIAENNAKGVICGAIENRLDFVFQQAEEGTSYDSTQVRKIGAEACKLTTSSMRLGQRYWEKVATTTDSGERVTRYKVFSTVEMPEADFKRALIAAAKAQQGKSGLSASFAEKVDAHWDSFVKGQEQ